jgi:nicotinate dehydrogenase subunit B
MCLWSRADELSWSPFGAAMRMALSAGLDAAGRITTWHHDVWSPPHLARPGFGDGVNLLAASHLAKPHAPAPENDAPRPQGGGDRNAVPLYKLGRRKITHHLMPQGPLRSSAMRTLGAHGNVFAIESFIDELAAKAGIDPLQFRLNHLDDVRCIGVLKVAAELSRWDASDKGGDGKGRGIAFARYKNLGSYFAVVAEVEVTEQVRLVRMSAAIDAGQVIHRDGLINQIEGGIIQAASWTLKEACGWTNDGFATRSWADYPILKFSETPVIDVAIIERPGEASLGAGECAAGPVAAAIGNAVAHAIGVRVRDMPLTPDRIQAAIHAL